MADENQLPSGYSADQYISERVKQYQSWYDQKAVSCKSRYLRMRAFTVVGGGLVPVLANVQPLRDVSIYTYDVATICVTLISLVVVVFVSLESVFHYREQWKNYRSTEQSLGHETVQFRAGVGPYTNLDSKDAFKRLVERVETMIATENAATLNVLTLAEATASKAEHNE